MHEMSIVVHLAKTIDELATEKNLAKVGKVTIEVGEVSGIIPMFFSQCWDFYKEKYPVLAGAELVQEKIEAVTFCENCGKTYPTIKYAKICPHCGSGETYLIDGNQCIIKEIEAATAEDLAEAEQTE